MALDQFGFILTIFSVLIIIIPTKYAEGQPLSATVVDARLPWKTHGLSALYDLDDSIYIFGGPEGETLKYYISEDRMETAGEMTWAYYGGTPIMNKHKEIYYIPGNGYNSCGQTVPILQYFPEFKNFSRAGSTYKNGYFATVVVDQDTALMFGGGCLPSGVVTLDTNIFSSELIPSPLLDEYSKASGIWLMEGTAYIFGNGADGSNIQKFQRSTNRTSIVPVRIALADQAQAIWDGRYGYIIGGRGTDYSGSIIKFDPVTESVSYIPVEGYPGGGGNGEFTGTAAVYVAKLKRIYMIGGRTSENHDEIWYISLDSSSITTTTSTSDLPTTTNEPMPTLDPGVFDCAGRPNTVYPYPGDCAKFIICLDDNAYPFECQDRLLFHQVNRHCTFPQLADCQLI